MTIGSVLSQNMLSFGTTKDLQKSRALAEQMPNLLLSAYRVANTVTIGLHGRRRAGRGEHFWEYRPYYSGESVARIDWRRSANRDALYVREREWEAAHTFWLWPDITASMDYGSGLCDTTKRDRAILLVLALSFVLVRSGEQIGLLGSMMPKFGEKAVEQTAQALQFLDNPSALPHADIPSRLSHMIAMSDFLDPLDEIETWIEHMSSGGAQGYLIQIVDPIEEVFPFKGRVFFNDHEADLKFLAGKAETYRVLYQEQITKRRQYMEMICGQKGWTFLVHRTDRPATETLLTLCTRLMLT